MEKRVRCFVKMIKTSPYKLNLVTRLIRGQSVSSALSSLVLSKKRIADLVKKALMSAVANAENNHKLNPEKLIVVEAYVGKAMTLKRIRPGSRGQAKKILKPFSNLTIIVEEKKPAKKTNKKPVKSVKKEDK